MGSMKQAVSGTGSLIKDDVSSLLALMAWGADKLMLLSKL